MIKRWHSHISEEDWESLCDGCGLCCMHKFEDEDTGEILQTNVACKLFEADVCRCAQYVKRFEQVPDCLDIRAMKDIEMVWLPKTCAYRLTFEEKPLPEWHHLLTGSKSTVHDMGISMQNKCVPESAVREEDMLDYVDLALK